MATSHPTKTGVTKVARSSPKPIDVKSGGHKVTDSKKVVPASVSPDHKIDPHKGRFAVNKTTTK